MQLKNVNEIPTCVLDSARPAEVGVLALKWYWPFVSGRGCKSELLLYLDLLLVNNNENIIGSDGIKTYFGQT